MHVTGVGDAIPAQPQQAAADFSDIGFDYMLAICSAIEEISRRLVHVEPAALSYRGANLRFAIERDLYFSLLNNDPVRAYYLQLRQVPGRSPGGRVAGEFRCSAANGRLALHYVPSAGAVLRRTAARLRNRCLGRAAQRLTNRLLRSAPEISKSSLYVVTHHPRFVSYLEPIVREFGADHVTWISTSRLLSEFLRKRHLPYVPLDRWTELTYGRASGPLLHAPSPGYSYMLAQHDALRELFSVHRPGCLLLVEGNSPGDEVANQAAHAAGIPTVCIQQGWSPVIHVGFRNMSYSKMLVWGQGFAQELQPYNPNQQFVVTGSHALDQAAPSPPDWLRLQAEERTVVTFFLQSPRDMIGPRRWREFLRLAAAVAQRWPSVLVLVREHPQYKLTADDRLELAQAQNICISRPADCGLAETLAASHISVSIYSTTILESVAAGVPPVIYNCTSMPRFSPDVGSLGAGVEVRDFAGALREIGELIENSARRDALRSGMDRFRQHYFHGQDGQSCTRIVSEIRQVAGVSATSS